VARVLASHDRLTVREAVAAWRGANRSLAEAAYRHGWIHMTIRAQRNGILVALDTEAARERHDLN